MSKFFEKRRKRWIGGLALLLSASLTMGIVSACVTTNTDEEEEKNPAASATDSQTLKNGNFEFYGEMDEEDLNERRNFISSPNDWTFSSGSPSSSTSSGVVNVNSETWDYMTKSTCTLIPAEEDRVSDAELTSAAEQYAVAHWEEASVYDRLEFYDYYDIDSASEFELYADYRYSNDFEDLEYLHEVATDKPLLYEKENRADDTSVLMIHNRVTSNNVRGTGQYYTSSTTITLHAGTAAMVSVWVRTSELYHYAATANGENDVEVTRRAGAYIGVTNTVGGTTLDQMQIKNINTKDTWQKYTVYIRANTFATTTFRLVLGLGQGSSDNRYESVDGYAFFDDVECKIISDKAFADAVEENNLKLPGKNFCDLDSKGDDRKFYATDNTTGEQTAYMTYALDLHTGFETYPLGDKSETRFGLTEEVSGSQTYTSAGVDPSLYDSTNDTENADKKNIADFLTYSEIAATGNGYLRDIFENDFKDKFPFYNADQKVDETMPVIMLLSTNGAAYTAKLPAVEVAPNSRMLVSFFVKTSKIRSGKTGASAILYDGGNVSGTISAFDSTTVAPVDIESDSEDAQAKDIYKGWVQCFFFVQNDTDDVKQFHIELTYGPTAIASSAKTDYADGYAAFTNFQQRDLSKSQYSYAATGTYAQKVSLTASVKDPSKFSDASANGPTLEQGLAIPVGYTGVLAGSNLLVESEKDQDGNILNKNPDREQLAAEGLYAGLLSSEYAKNYLDTTAEEGESVPAWKTRLNEIANNATDPDQWWKTIFGDNGTSSFAAYQPLVILNTSGAAKPAYGFFAGSTNVAANGASKISVRVKLSKGATAYLYLTDVSDVKKGYDSRLAPTLPKATYWYDDEGNIVAKDPSAEDFDEEKDVLYTLEENGLYKKVGETAEVYYANLSAFGEPNEEGNLVTTSGTIAYYGHEGKYYAYYNKNTDEYSQEVSPLPTSNVRYPAYVDLNAADYEAAIKVVGTDENADRWVEVSFYVQTGNTQKNYRLELWAGERNSKTNGIPKDGYVFFDSCKTESVSNYSTLLDLTKEAMLSYQDAEGKYVYRDQTDSKKLSAENALYYTFTFFDSPDYLRYDKTQDEDELGDPWGSYTQSSHTEQLTWLYCEDYGENLLDAGAPSVSLYISYAANEVTVTPDELGSTDTDNNSSDNNSNSTGNGLGDTNIWLLLSSILLAAALVFAVIAVFVRRYLAKRKKTVAPKPKKEKQPRAPKPKEETPAEEAPAEAPVDENDPYNE